MSSTQPDFSAKRGDLVCRPMHWMDIVRFLVFNFALHAVTVMSSPGEGAGRWITKRLIALFIPLVGTIAAVRTIYRYARGENTPLAVALRAQALCMIAPAVGSPTDLLTSYGSLTRLQWLQTEPLGRMNPSGILSESHLSTPNRTGYVTWVSRLTGIRRSSDAPDPQLPRTISLTVTTIQGQHPFEKPSYKEWAKSGFRTAPRSTAARLVTVPWNSTVAPLLSDRPDNFDLAYNYSAVKILAAIAQILYGTFQLYQSSGPQITKAGYAAYQLALIPYIIMSLINLLASLCEPEFPAMFLVRQDPPPGDRPEEMSGEVGKASPPAVEGTLHSTRKNTVCLHSLHLSRAKLTTHCSIRSRNTSS